MKVCGSSTILNSIKMKKWISLICLLLIFIIQVNSDYRLPTAVIPHNYDLEIKTYLDELNDIDAFHFTGKVTIKIECMEPTKNITIHSKDLQIDHDKIEIRDLESSNTNIKIVDYGSEPKKDFFMIHLEKQLKRTRLYEVVLEFEGKLVGGLAGYYRSSYTDKHTKKQHWLAVTQFEPTDARRAFPCFDEPSLKAKFKITLGHRDHLNSISNMPLEKTEKMKDKQGWVWNKFEESVPMSTYLVAFVVSDFDYKTSAKHDNNVTFNIWARKDALSQVDFATEIGPRALNFFEEYFNIKYPLPKQDMIALPDFSSGAMENWGLITYREVYLLYDPELASASSKHRITSVISHELAHQWFGNLVTMKWWTDLWLNEGFATYMASLAVHHMFPKWNSLKEEAVKNLLSVFSLDSLKSSHPISVPIKNPNDINQIFDTISYQKGSFLIRMMGLFLGENVLKKGVSNYLKEHAYQNAEQDDLWESLTQQAHKEHTLPENFTVKQIMDTWTLQTGYPVITVTRNYADGTAEITQERYFGDSIKAAGKSVDECWWVPLSYTTESEADVLTSTPKSWLSCPKSTHTINGLISDEWVMFNIQASGLYKVNYDKRNWEMLISSLKNNIDAIPVLNRVLLVDNSMELAWTGRLTYEIPFELLSYIKHETDYLPWKAALSKLGSVSTILRRTASFGLFKTYITKIVKPTYERMGGLTVAKEKSDSLDSVKHQVLMASVACAYGVSECTQTVIHQFKLWKNNPEEQNIISQDMKPVVYCTAIKHGGEEEWDFLWQEYRKSNVGTEKSVILRALGCTRETWLLYRYLEWSIRNDTEIRKQDVPSIFSGVAGTTVGYFVAKSFFESRIKDIYLRLAPNQQRLSYFVDTLSDQMTSQYELDEFEDFISKNMKYFEKSKLGVEQALETVKINVQWQKKHYRDVENILHKYLNE